MPSLPRKNPEANSAERIEASGGWWQRPESNQRHTNFQSAALPTELLGRAGASGIRSARKRSADYTRKVLPPPRSWCAIEHSYARSSPRGITTLDPLRQKKARLKGGLIVPIEFSRATLWLSLELDSRC